MQNPGRVQRSECESFIIVTCFLKLKVKYCVSRVERRKKGGHISALITLSPLNRHSSSSNLQHGPNK